MMVLVAFFRRLDNGVQFAAGIRDLVAGHVVGAKRGDFLLHARDFPRDRGQLLGDSRLNGRQKVVHRPGHDLGKMHHIV
jgi:hypothetical protein